MDNAQHAEVSIILQAFAEIVAFSTFDDVMVMFVSKSDNAGGYDLHVAGKGDRMTCVQLLADLATEAVAVMRADRAGHN